MTSNVSLALLCTQTDARLAGLAAAGHDRAFEAIVARYRQPLLRYARSFKLDEGVAEDVVQVSCLAAWAALRDGTDVHDLRSWLYRIVHNSAINALRTTRGASVPLVEVPDERPGPHTNAESREEVRSALDGIAALPDRQRAALVAVAIDGRAHADVGEELGVSDMAVRKLVSRARGSLRAAATAVTPLPIATWLAQATGAGGDQAVRIAELVTVGGSAGLAGGSMVKAGAVVLTVGAVAAGAPQVTEDRRAGERPEAAQPNGSASRSAPSISGELPRAVTTGSVTVAAREDSDRASSDDAQGTEDGDGAGPAGGQDSDADERDERSGRSRGDDTEREDANRESDDDDDDDRRRSGSGESGSDRSRSDDSTREADDTTSGRRGSDDETDGSDESSGPDSDDADPHLSQSRVNPSGSGSESGSADEAEPSD